VIDSFGGLLKNSGCLLVVAVGLLIVGIWFIGTIFQRGIYALIPSIGMDAAGAFGLAITIVIAVVLLIAAFKR
jgi:hypothetical protein